MTLLLLMTFLVLIRLPVQGQTISGQVNAYYAISDINTVSNAVSVDNAAGLSAGDRVLIIQAKGAVIGSTNAATFGNITTLNGAGLYEINTICSITGNEVVLKAPLLNTYETAGQVQLVSVASYGSVTISGTITGAAWDPVTGKGGVVVIEASGTIYLNAGIDVSGLGFWGGALVNYPTPTWDCSFNNTVNQYYLPLPASGDFTGGKKGEGIAAYIAGAEYGRGKQANGGGGGNNANSGGAGGGSYGAGGAGGQRSGEAWYLCHGAYPGIGGLGLASYGYSTAANRIFLGGGGGSGHENNGVGEPGGNGGGIIILSAAAIVGGGGQLLAAGLSPVNPACQDPYQAEGDGGGGGGAGGAIILNASSISGAIIAIAKGAKGSNAANRINDCTGPGGGGGGGIVWTAGSVFAGSVSADVSGGANGVVSTGSTSTTGCQGSPNGAAAGVSGASMANYQLPESTGNTCIPLATDGLKYFRGHPGTGGYQLSWAFETGSAAKTDNFTLQRSADHLHFTSLAIVPCGPGQPSFGYTDTSAPTAGTGTLYYRLLWKGADGADYYSQILAWTMSSIPDDLSLRIYPNPAAERLSIQVSSNGVQPLSLQLFTAQGQLLASYTFTLHDGLNSLALPVRQLPAATYFLVADIEGRRVIRSFIKR